MPGNAGFYAQVGTTLFNMSVNPANGKVYVSNLSPLNPGGMRPLQVRQDAVRNLIPWRDVPQHGALRTPVVVRAAGGHQTVARGAALEKLDGVWVVAVMVDLKADESHGFEDGQKRVHNVWVCTQRAWVGQRTHPPSLSD